MNTITINKATESDIPVIKSMADIVFRQTYGSILTTQQIEYMMELMYSDESLEKQFCDGHCFFIALCKDTTIGYISIQKEGITEDNATLYHIHKLYVMPEWQGSGMGKFLFKQACEYASLNKNSVKARIELNVNRFNKAVGFYLKMGMKIAREGDFPIGDGYYMNDYIMSIEI